MAAPTPDIAGFVDAQQRHRENFGEPIDFLFPAVVTFPPGTPIDPETNMPYDPTVEPTASAQAVASAKCNVTWHAIGRASLVGEAEYGQAGMFEKDHVMLIADIAASGTVEGAESFVCRDEQYEITATKIDGIGAPDQRFLIYGRRGT